MNGFSTNLNRLIAISLQLSPPCIAISEQGFVEVFSYPGYTEEVEYQCWRSQKISPGSAVLCAHLIITSQSSFALTVLVNLAPRALRGVESQGMILMTENAEGKLVFVNPDDKSVANGLHIS